jgi:TRAP-type C4-dicarboxylate transport system permease small subunit
MKKIAVWGFLFAGVLGILTGVRDIFAPGFFTISPRIPGQADIILQFVAGACFLALAAFANWGGFDRTVRK